MSLTPFTIDRKNGKIDINGGFISATGGKFATGIGGGMNGSCGDITITTGITSLTATKGDSAPEFT